MSPSDGASIASMTLLGLIQAIPAEQTAVIAPEQNIRITYGALRKQIQAVAEALAASGVTRGDRVGIALPNGLPNIVTFLAASCRRQIRDWLGFAEEGGLIEALAESEWRAQSVLDRTRERSVEAGQ